MFLGGPYDKIPSGQNNNFLLFMHGNSAFHQCLLLLKSSLMYRTQCEAVTHWLCAALLYNTARACSFFGSWCSSGSSCWCLQWDSWTMSCSHFWPHLFQPNTALCVRKALYDCITCGFAAGVLFRGQQSVLTTIRAPLPESPSRDKHKVLLVLLSPVFPGAEAL